jgi:hypothetical protein
MSEHSAPLLWDWVTTCAACGLSPATAERLLRQGEFVPIVRVGRKRYCRPDDARSWASSRAKPWRAHKAAPPNASA